MRVPRPPRSQVWRLKVSGLETSSLNFVVVFETNRTHKTKKVSFWHYNLITVVSAFDTSVIIPRSQYEHKK